MVPKILERKQKKIVPVATEDDKRYFPRWEVNKRVEYVGCCEAKRTALQCYTKDLSLDGTSIFVFGNPPARKQVLLRIHLADKETFEAQGSVAWSKLEPTYKLFGIVFNVLTKKTQELIMRHAFELKENHLLIYGIIRRFHYQKVFFFPKNPLSSSSAIPSEAASASGGNRPSIGLAVKSD